MAPCIDAGRAEITDGPGQQLPSVPVAAVVDAAAAVILHMILSARPHTVPQSNYCTISVRRNLNFTPPRERYYKKGNYC